MAGIRELRIPILPEEVDSLEVGEMITISGGVLAGRDAVLPKICALIEAGDLGSLSRFLRGGVVFHTAVSLAGVGPTSSNKIEIEGSFDVLSSVGVRMHLGKGSISSETVSALARRHACFAVIPPVTALLGEKTRSSKVLAFPELGIEALHLLEAEGYPAIIAAVNGRSMFESGTNG
ncbi:fumarate hydratase C-terminal domain-containing protein [Adlercreutzia sp. ZJ473]|uniref:fumarate hydratase C-terminal domain-containing protein n=1 Tax=Adlercreutzia sp. ZJ473 TaxID=2722822 RepID=UPI0015576F94|nr:fumarate hydratase C-terminal domain-containing protein [Adlercreutzia sp. ZJ473]